MHLGIFAKTFVRPNLEETLDAVAHSGLTHVQFNMSCVGLPTLPERIPDELCERIAGAFRERGLTMAAVSGTFNLLRPKETRILPGRSQPVEFDYFQRVETLATCCPWLDTRIITLCTGTLDPDDMWRRHPENDSEAAWESLVTNMKVLAEIADRHEVTLAFEPEGGNVVNSAAKARKLLDEVGSPWLKVVIDPANLFPGREWTRWGTVLEEAFELLGPDIVLAHVKHLTANVENLISATESRGLDPEVWARFVQAVLAIYLGLLSSHGYNGSLILHGLAEDDVPRSVETLRRSVQQILAWMLGEGAR
jgi:sugar phosphate isomerase/epimerase